MTEWLSGQAAYSASVLAGDKMFFLQAAGEGYPTVLLTTGVNDPRVAVWQPGKITARLQAATTSGRPVLLRELTPR